MSMRTQAHPTSSGRDHYIDAHDVVRGQTRYHCEQDLSRISLERAHRSDQAIQQYLRSRPAQASSLKVYLFPKAPRNNVECVTKPDVFSRHAIFEIVSKHGLHNTARAASAARSHSPFMQESTMSTCWRRPSLFCSQWEPDVGFIGIA